MTPRDLAIASWRTYFGKRLGARCLNVDAIAERTVDGLESLPSGLRLDDAALHGDVLYVNVSMPSSFTSRIGSYGQLNMRIGPILYLAANARLLVSRNKREGRYVGWRKGSRIGWLDGRDGSKSGHQREGHGDDRPPPLRAWRWV